MVEDLQEPANQTSPAPRDDKKSTRWEHIIKAASKLFAEKGFHRTTTKQIADAANVSEGTLYNYFLNKNDIMFGILTQLADKQVSPSDISPVKTLGARDFFSAYFNQRKSHIDQNFTMMQSILSEVLSDEDLRARYNNELLTPSIELMEKHIQMRMALGQMRKLNIQLTARVISGLLMGLFVLKAAGDPYIDKYWDEIVTIMIDILFDGLEPQSAH